MKYAFTKIGMTSAFDQTGKAFGVTVLKMRPAKIVRHERLEDGRTAVIVEYDLGVRKKIQRGWVVAEPSLYPIGSTLKSPQYLAGQKIKITGVSKGRGFQDVITRHGYSGGPASHGSRFHRAPGSVGMRTEPGRVFKGKKLPGHDGSEQITMRNIKIISWSEDESLMAVLSGVPGSRGSVVFV